MNIKVLTKSGLPIYEQIERQIKDSIVSGELKENDALPSIRALAADLKISVISSITVVLYFSKCAAMT